MEATIYCLVDGTGTVYEKAGAESFSEIAANFGLDERACTPYRFDLTNRRLFMDRGNPESHRSVRDYLDRRVGTPERLMKFAEEGRLPKHVLMNLLAQDSRAAYLVACAAIERKYTNDCAARNDPCLESGCAVEGEICLQPLLRAEIDYHRACAGEWIKVFANPRNRIDAWKN